jgi:hypothetical protein
VSIRYHTAPVFIPVAFSPFGERVFFTGCFLVSFILVAHLWIFHRNDKLGTKIIWSALILLPVLGWVFYWAFYNSSTDDPTDSKD